MLSTKILGVRVDRIGLNEAVDLVGKWVKQTKKRYIVTTNPEFVMLAQKDAEFKQIINQADLSICDGAGLALAIKGTDLKGQTFLRVTGRDLMLALIKKGYKTVLVGGKPGVAEKAAEMLRSDLVGVPTRTDLEGLIVGISDPNVEQINQIKPDLLFVALGQGKQEKWIVKNLPKLKVKVAMGVGGALDQIAKPWLVAPKILQAFGLEWLYRLIVQPWRLKRQWQLARFLIKIKI